MRGLAGFIVLIIGVLILAVVMILITSKLLSKSEANNAVDLGAGQDIPTNPRDVQNKVNDLQNQLQQKQNENLGGE
ncbi:hypothetical protein HY382_03020 [Candidatus Curtissbacteria bacterium]|nr:hypothetical protein [Candidatus Curtissbacteria bacterium]